MGKLLFSFLCLSAVSKAGKVNVGKHPAVRERPVHWKLYESWTPALSCLCLLVWWGEEKVRTWGEVWLTHSVIYSHFLSPWLRNMVNFQLSYYMKYQQIFPSLDIASFPIRWTLDCTSSLIGDVIIMTFIIFFYRKCIIQFL